MEYLKEIIPIGFLNYETGLKSRGWEYNGNCMTKEGMLYLWKRKIK